jgi:hypothetical protein
MGAQIKENCTTKLEISKEKGGHYGRRTIMRLAKLLFRDIPPQEMHKQDRDTLTLMKHCYELWEFVVYCSVCKPFKPESTYAASCVEAIMRDIKNDTPC